MDNNFKPPFSFLPSLKQKTALILILAYEWLMIGFATIKTFDVMAYDGFSGLFTILSIITMLVMLMFVLNSSPKPDLSKKETTMAIILIVSSFVCYVVVSNLEHIIR